MADETITRPGTAAGETIRRLRRLVHLRRLGRPFWRGLRIFYRALTRFMANDGLYMASALAFSLIIAIFPFILFLTALAGFLGGTQLAAYLTVTLFDVMPNRVAETLEPEIWNVLVHDRGGLFTFGVVVMLASVTSMVETVRGGLNRAYGIAETRAMVRTALESVLFVVLTTVALMLAALLAVIFPVAYGMVSAQVPAMALTWERIEMLRLGVLGIVLGALLWAAHRWLPAHGRDRPALWPGVLLTLAMWYFGGRAFSYYLTSFADYARYYAGLAGIVAALLFFYIAATILLFAGAFNRALHEWRMERRALKRLAQG